MAAKKRTSRSAKSKSAKLKKQSKEPRLGRPVAKPKARSVTALAPEAGRLQIELRETIESDVADRIRSHQRELVRLRGQLATRPEAKPPLMILSHGDSWFDYPLKGNKWPSPETDIIAHLRKMGSPPPRILNLSHFGDATTDEMGLEKQKRLIKALRTPENWLNGKPDAILFSGGGNDIAGDPFCIYLDYKTADSQDRGLNSERFAGRLASVRSSYLDLFAFREHFAPGVPIFGHTYDLARPIPEPHPPCTGPWMWPGLSFAGWNIEEGTKIIHDALYAFRDMLVGLEKSDRPPYNFAVVPTQGTLTNDDWANELHPYPPGFQKLADKFLSALRSHFPGRI